MNILDKIKVLLLITVAGCGAVSCIDRKDEPNNDLVKVDYEAIKPITSQYYNVPEGKIAYVMNGSDTVGILTQSGYLQVPNMQNGAITRAASDLLVIYEDIPGMPVVYKANTLTYVLMFEDSSHGDNDYNDLVVHIQQKHIEYSNKTHALHLSIQPVAMGNTQKLKIGADIYLCDAQGYKIKSGRFYFSNDVKKDYFKENSETKMLRTWTKSTPYTPFNIIGTTVKSGYSLEDNSKSYSAINFRDNNSGMMPKYVEEGNVVFVNWFIENSNGSHRYYAIPSYSPDKSQWIAESGFPQGLAMCGLHDPIYETSYHTMTGSEWINYPLESINIETTYPGFRDWIEGNGAAPDWINPVIGTYFDAIGNNGGKSLFEIAYNQTIIK